MKTPEEWADVHPLVKALVGNAAQPHRCPHDEMVHELKHCWRCMSAAVTQAIQEAKAQGAAEEREACARLSLSMGSEQKIEREGYGYSTAAREIADAIRERGGTE